jgi:small subunit ribosomal protein S6
LQSEKFPGCSFKWGYPALLPGISLTIKIYMATESTLQDYEIMVIFTPVLSEDEYRNAQKKITDFISNAGGVIGNQNPWGLKSLAYPIAKKTTGLYYVLEYQAKSDTNAKLEIQMNRDETIMRHMITRLDKYAVIYNNRKRNKVETEETASQN